MSQPTARSSIDARLARLFGEAIDWRRASGVVHVAAIEARSRSVLAVGPGAPSSATDRFVLGFARARADAIVTTGAILRAEPELVHRFADDPDDDRLWQAWRREVVGRSDAPCVLVLSERGWIPPTHPALSAPGRRILWTRTAAPPRPGAGEPAALGTQRLELRLDPGGVGEGVGGAAASLERAIAWLRAEVGATTIAIEAGPAATLGLYRRAAERRSARPSPPTIDELLLSLFAGVGAPLVAGEAFPSAARLAEHFAGTPTRAIEPTTATPASASASIPDPLRSRVRIEEPSGSWIFERHRRAGSD